MDATQLLKRDHDKVRELAKRFEAAHESGDHDQVRSIVSELSQELNVHAEIEEEVFYPAVRSLEDEKLSELVRESIEEHHVVKVLDREIAALAESSDDKLSAKAMVLIENVEHHAEEEESEMFPRLRELMDQERLEQLGGELESARQRKTSSR